MLDLSMYFIYKDKWKKIKSTYKSQGLFPISMISSASIKKISSLKKKKIQVKPDYIYSLFQIKNLL